MPTLTAEKTRPLCLSYAMPSTHRYALQESRVLGYVYTLFHILLPTDPHVISSF